MNPNSPLPEEFNGRNDSENLLFYLANNLIPELKRISGYDVSDVIDGVWDADSESGTVNRIVILVDDTVISRIHYNHEVDPTDLLDYVNSEIPLPKGTILVFPNEVIGITTSQGVMAYKKL